MILTNFLKMAIPIMVIFPKICDFPQKWQLRLKNESFEIFRNSPYTSMNYISDIINMHTTYYMQHKLCKCYTYAYYIEIHIFLHRKAPFLVFDWLFAQWVLLLGPEIPSIWIHTVVDWILLVTMSSWIFKINKSPKLLKWLHRC